MSAQELITQHLDIWTAAHKTRSSAGRGSSNKLDLYGIKKLRELILELAVSGNLIKVTEHIDHKHFLEQVSEEKNRIIADSGTSKVKEISDESTIRIPARPQHWELVKVNEIFITTQGVQISKAEQIQDAMPGYDRYLYISDFKSNDELKFVKDTYPHKKVTTDDLVMANTGSPGEVYFGVPGILSNNLFKLSFSKKILIQKYVYIYFKSLGFVSSLKRMLKGGAQQHLGHKLIGSQYIVFPPLPEQHRIVAKVDELLAFCDQLEQTQSDNIAAHAQLVEALLATLTDSRDHNELQNNWQRIAAHFDTLFTTEHSIDQLKQTILQLAVMGKLVPQNPFDEPASELLKKIAAEKAQLIKEGKIKKEKPLPEITDEEKPFELPRGWVWEKLSNITTGMDSGWSPACLANSSPSNEVWGVLKTTAVQIMEYLEFENKELPENLTPRPDAEVKHGDILFTRAGPMNRVGISCLVEKTRPKLMISDKIIRFHPVESGIYGRFISLCLNVGGTASYLESAKSGMAASQVNISQEKLRSAPIPIAPLTEQHRIVAKVDELMSLCDTLKINLQNAQTTQLALADALVEQAIE